jgi:hypothetical protein
LTFRVTLPASRYGDEGAVTRFYDTLVERLEANESVQSVAGMSTLFLQRLPNMSPITVEGHPPEGPDAPRISVTTDAVLGDLPATLGMRIVSGRWFSAADDERVPPVAIVNQTFVRTFLVAGEEPIGTRFFFGQPGDNATPSWITIVGVLADSKRSGLAQPVRPEALFPHAQARDNALQIIVATRAEPMAILPAVHQVMREIPRRSPSSVACLR